jgi:HAD superfamily hydrolase (TIGR01509 family)
VSARPILEAVVFDAGGTLVRLDFEWMSEWLGGQGVAIAPAVLRRAEIEGRRAYDASRGHAPRPGEPHPPLGSGGDTLAYFGGTLDAAGVPAALRTAMLEAMSERQRGQGLWTQPVEGARGVLDALPGMGLRIACVSNSDGRAAWHLEQCGVLAGLEFVVDSQLEGVEKPDPRIFAIALARLGVAPDRALYVGDIRSVDERGARAAGMHFVLIDPIGDYGDSGGAAIAEIAALPSWIARGFEIAPRAHRA